MKKFTIPLIVTLMTAFTGLAHAWPEVDHMNMCGAAVKVIRDYQGDPKSWNDRDKYTELRKAKLYFQANCPETKAGKTEKTVSKKVTHDYTPPRPQPRLASCKDCFDAGYKKGFQDGKSVIVHNNPATSSSVTTPPEPQDYKPSSSVQVIQHGDHHHHNAVHKADCALADALNRRPGPVVTVSKRH
ncbi:MAG: hypothetical protein CSB47_08540 [Proteobacteria bacterium]|nr:MAG: hypothetical protein CSB47_08540 [Pseudomonadota bacterium]